MLVSGRTKYKFLKQMLPEMKHIILTNMNVKLYSWPLTFCKLQGSAAADEGRWQFYSSFLYRSFLNLSEKNCENGPLLPKLL